jgi:hypothetical protein
MRKKSARLSTLGTKGRNGELTEKSHINDIVHGCYCYRDALVVIRCLPCRNHMVKRHIKYSRIHVMDASVHSRRLVHQRPIIWWGKNLGLEKFLISGVSPKERPDRSNTTERTIASSKSGSTSASWNISRRRSSERDLMRHRATARPGRLVGSSCS